MITINGKELRNLEEQVLKNKQDIARHYNIDRVIADFGIKVLGELNSLDDIPAENYEYGDCYIIGTAYPKSFYVYTRANPDVGEDDDYWLDIGPLSIVGPQGIPGPQGEKGDTGESTRWYYVSPQKPQFPQNVPDGTMVLFGSVVYAKEGGKWVESTNIKGPQGAQGNTGPQGIQGEQGPQGIQGPKGETGGLLTIQGIIPTVGELPNPSQMPNMSAAYLVGTTTPYTLYALVGTVTQYASWTSLGPLNGSTVVTVGGQGVAVFDADTKFNAVNPNALGVLDQNKEASGYAAAYTKDGDPNSYVGWSYSNEANTLVMRNSASRIYVNMPLENYHAANKGYVDTAVNGRLPMPDFSSEEKATIVSPGQTNAFTLKTRKKGGTLLYLRYSPIGNPIGAALDLGYIYIDTKDGGSSAVVYGFNTQFEYNQFYAEAYSEAYTSTEEGVYTDGIIKIYKITPDGPVEVNYGKVMFNIFYRQ